MAHTPENILPAWLSKLGFHVSGKFIRQLVKSHPDYPALLSITDTLDYLGIENGAFEIEKDRLHEIDTPFLVHLKKAGGGEFVIVNNRDNLESRYPGFFENWTGVVVAAEKKGNWSHSENGKELLQEKKQNLFNVFAAATLLALAASSFVFAKTWIAPALVVTGLAGAFISWLIITRELGIESKAAETVCGSGADCDAVIKSGSAKLPFNLSWGDIGMGWFTSLTAIVVFSSFAGFESHILNPLAMFSAAGTLFTFFSVYYQWKVAKKWCRLCLITVGLLWAQCLLTIKPLITGSVEPITVREVFFIAAVIVAAGVIWQWIKKLLVENKKITEDLVESLRFKRNETVFMALLQNQRKADITPWEEDFQLGNPRSPVQIMVACNTYCKPCASAHETLHSLLESFNDNIGLTVRFTVATDNVDDKRNMVVGQMISHLHTGITKKTGPEKRLYTRRMIHDWFKEMDYEKFSAKYALVGVIDVRDTLKLHESWMKESEIKFTPTIFINGHQLPKQYEASDLAGLINGVTALLLDAKLSGAELEPVETVLI